MTQAYILDIVRTPVGKFGGALATVRPDDLAALVIRSLMKRNPEIDPELVEDIVLGAANQAGEDNRDVARMAGLLAGIPITTGGVTVNRLCASGLQAIMDAAKGIMAGMGDVYIAGGVESMTRAPFVMAKAETAYARSTEIYDTTIGWRFVNPKLSAIHHPYSMGETAENVAKQWNIGREAQDHFAFTSQVRYQEAHARHAFKQELVPVEIALSKAEKVLFDKDEHPRATSIEKLAQLKPAFREGGSVTAGNSSGINDGAAACLMVSESLVHKLGLKPMARIVSMATAGVNPSIMGIGPVPASQKALKRAGLQVRDLDLIELNEAFAAQALACMQDLNLDPAKVNVNGGSIAIGHPLGASGVRISATLLHEMAKRSEARYGLATMCIGVGQGAAVVFEKV